MRLNKEEFTSEEQREYSYEEIQNFVREDQLSVTLRKSIDRFLRQKKNTYEKTK